MTNTVARLHALAVASQVRYSGAMLKRKTPMRRKAATTKKSTTAHRKRKRAERAEHNAETAEIREAVFERAGGKCECSVGCQDVPSEMDHAVPRRHGQSVEACWALSSEHHKMKTENKPDALTWAQRFHRHCLIHGYEGEATKAKIRIEVLTTRASLASMVVSR